MKKPISATIDVKLLKWIDSQVSTAIKYGQIPKVKSGQHHVPLALDKETLRNFVGPGFSPFLRIEPSDSLAFQASVYIPIVDQAVRVSTDVHVG